MADRPVRILPDESAATFPSSSARRRASRASAAAKLEGARFFLPNVFAPFVGDAREKAEGRKLGNAGTRGFELARFLHQLALPVCPEGEGWKSCPAPGADRHERNE